MPHIAEIGFVDRSVRLDDDPYAMVLDNVVVCCADCAVICGNDMLLGRRRNEPAIHQWWIMGGRMKVGEDPRQTAKRILAREIELSILNHESIVELNLHISFPWAKRSQPPAGHGCHMVGLYFFVEIPKGIRKALEGKRDNANFSEFVWRPIRDVARDSLLHPGIQLVGKRIAEHLKLNSLARRTLRNLRNIFN